MKINNEDEQDELKAIAQEELKPLAEQIGKPKSYWVKKNALQTAENFFAGYVPSKAIRIKEAFNKAFTEIIREYEETLKNVKEVQEELKEGLRGNPPYYEDNLVMIDKIFKKRFGDLE